MSTKEKICYWLKTFIEGCVLLAFCFALLWLVGVLSNN